MELGEEAEMGSLPEMLVFLGTEKATEKQNIGTVSNQLTLVLRLLGKGGLVYASTFSWQLHSRPEIVKPELGGPHWAHGSITGNNNCSTRDGN